MKDVDEYLNDIAVEQIDVGRLDYIVTHGRVLKVVRDSHWGQPYLLKADDIPDDYKQRWKHD